MLQIKWTKRALFAFSGTLKFWNEHNKSHTYSTRLRKEVRKAETLICKNPYLGNNSEIKNVRYFLVLKHFSLYYRVKNETIEVLSFWDNRRNPDDLKV